jgi:hypothetical protein
MKKLFVALACVVLVPVGCRGAQPESTQVPTSAPETKPTEVLAPTFTAAPTPTPDKCPEAAVETFADEMDEIDSEFRDIWRIADATPRLSLSPFVLDLQKTRNRMAELEYPRCLASCYQCELNGMDMVIEAFLASMKDEPDWYVQVYLQEVDATFALAQKHLEAVQATGTPASSECSVDALQQTIHEVSGITVEAMSDLQEGDPLPEGLVSKLLSVEAPECLEAYVEHTYEFLHWSGELRECQKEHTSCPYEEFAVKVYSQVAYWKLSEAWAQLVAVE